MKIRVLRAVGALFLAGSFCASAWADVFLNDKSEIVGTWVLEAVAMNLKAPKIEENRIWDFRADGVVVTSGFNRHLHRDDTKEFKYNIENGKIKAEDPGRPGKFSDYVVHEKTDKTMVLKGGLEGAYFFKKK